LRYYIYIKENYTNNTNSFWFNVHLTKRKVIVNDKNHYLQVKQKIMISEFY